LYYPNTIFNPFWKFGQATLKAIFIKKSRNQLWTCDLVLSWRRINFYTVPTFISVPLSQDTFFSPRFMHHKKNLIKKCCYFKLFSVILIYVLQHVPSWPKFDNMHILCNKINKILQIVRHRLLNFHSNYSNSVLFYFSIWIYFCSHGSHSHLCTCIAGIKENMIFARIKLKNMCIPRWIFQVNIINKNFH
jgi:hypothetical protein